jgi:hypothetical protein
VKQSRIVRTLVIGKIIDNVKEIRIRGRCLSNV